MFFSYSHKDSEFLKELEVHLNALRRQGVITWADRNIALGDEWNNEIKKALDEAGVIVILVSPDYLASDFCWDVELKHAIEKHQLGSATVIPVILRPSDWRSSPISHLQVLPLDGKPVSSFSDRDSAWMSVVNEIKARISPTSWIFQGVPSRYDVADKEKVNDGLEETWLVTRYRKEIKIGDIVYFWRSGDEDKRGIYAWGKVITNPEEYSQWGWGVTIRYVKRLPQHINAAVLKRDSDFSNHLLYRMPTGTNFSLSDKEAKAINRAIQSACGKDFVPAGTYQ